MQDQNEVLNFEDEDLRQMEMYHNLIEMDTKTQNKTFNTTYKC